MRARSVQKITLTSDKFLGGSGGICGATRVHSSLLTTGSAIGWVHCATTGLERCP
jgi:hypothetical protein